MNTVADPGAEVDVVQFAHFFRVTILNQCFQIVVVELDLVSEVAEEVFDCDKAVMICIKRQECLTN